MDYAAVDRGGSFGRTGHEARNWMRASAPGIAFRCRPAESSPIGSGADPGCAAVKRPRRATRTVLIALLAAAGLACFGSGIYIHAKAALAQSLLHAAWARTQATAADAKPWPCDAPVPTLTLVTCYPFDALSPGGPMRYIVVAEAA